MSNVTAAFINTEVVDTAPVSAGHFHFGNIKQVQKMRRVPKPNAF